MTLTLERNLQLVAIGRAQAIALHARNVFTLAKLVAEQAKIINDLAEHIFAGGSGAQGEPIEETQSWRLYIAAENAQEFKPLLERLTPQLAMLEHHHRDIDFIVAYRQRGAAIAAFTFIANAPLVPAGEALTRSLAAALASAAKMGILTSSTTMQSVKFMSGQLK